MKIENIKWENIKNESAKQQMSLFEFSEDSLLFILNDFLTKLMLY